MLTPWNIPPINVVTVKWKNVLSRRIITWWHFLIHWENCELSLQLSLHCTAATSRRRRTGWITSCRIATSLYSKPRFLPSVAIAATPVLGRKCSRILTRHFKLTNQFAIVNWRSRGGIILIMNPIHREEQTFSISSFKEKNEWTDLWK